MFSARRKCLSVSLVSAISCSIAHTRFSDHHCQLPGDRRVARRCQSSQCNRDNATSSCESTVWVSADLWRTRSILTELGSNRHPMPWYIRKSPVKSSWTVFYYTSHLDLAVFFQLAAICRSWVNPWLNCLFVYLWSMYERCRSLATR